MAGSDDKPLDSVRNALLADEQRMINALDDAWSAVGDPSTLPTQVSAFRESIHEYVRATNKRWTTEYPSARQLGRHVLLLRNNAEVNAARLELIAFELKRSISETAVFSCSALLAEMGAGAEAVEMRRIASTLDLRQLAEHASQLERRLREQARDPERDLLEVRLPWVRGTPEDADAEASEQWYFEHETGLAKRYPQQFVAVTRDGVVAASLSKRHVLESVDGLQWAYGPFWAYFGDPCNRRQMEPGGGSVR